MQRTFDETDRRRKIQEAYNTEHGITPTGINRAVEERMNHELPAEAKRVKLDLLVVEHPVIYPGMPSKDLNDLIDVATVGAAVNSALYLNANAYQTVFPAEWKGNVPKKTMLERIKSRLTPEELKRCEFTNKSDNEDLLDAVGMGLWHSGRLNKRSYPGAT
jgi:hypothetical protein